MVVLPDASRRAFAYAAAGSKTLGRHPCTCLLPMPPIRRHPSPYRCMCAWSSSRMAGPFPRGWAFCQVLCRPLAPGRPTSLGASSLLRQPPGRVDQGGPRLTPTPYRLGWTSPGSAGYAPLRFVPPCSSPLLASPRGLHWRIPPIRSGADSGSSQIRPFFKTPPSISSIRPSRRRPFPTGGLLSPGGRL